MDMILMIKCNKTQCVNNKAKYLDSTEDDECKLNKYQLGYYLKDADTKVPVCKNYRYDDKKQRSLKKD